jgi:hypothetical protein
MSAIAHRNELPAFEITGRSRTGARELAHTSLSLRATGDGWALLSSGGRVVFSALGLSGRHTCLEFARSMGVLSVRS